MKTDIKKIQYYPEDLAAALGIGAIADMYVVTEGGVQILRIEHLPKERDEFQTVRVNQRGSSSGQQGQRKHHGSGSGRGSGSRQQGARDSGGASASQGGFDPNKPNDLGDKLIRGAKNWLNKKDKPNFMKDAGF